MDDRTKEIQAIRELAQRLLNKIDAMSIDIETVEEPPEAKEKVARRVCLGCGVTVKDGEPYRRGLHGACYHTTMRRIRDGDWSEKERILAGRLAKEGRQGRPAAIDAAEILAKSIADEITKPKPKKVAEQRPKYQRKPTSE